MEVVFGIATNLFERLPNIVRSKAPPLAPRSTTDPILRIGIISVAKILPDGIILPAKNHSTVQIVVIAARDRKRAEAFAKQNGIPRVLDSYEQVTKDPEVDAIYIPLANGLHYKWAIESLKNGKHILLEKPSCCNADQAKEVFNLAKEKNLIALEAFHYRFHPALHLFGELVSQTCQKGANPLTHVSADFRIVGNGLPEDDFHYSASLGGGSVLDPGVYPICISLYTVRAASMLGNRDDFDFTRWSTEIECSQATPTVFRPRAVPLTTVHLDQFGKNVIDERMQATLLIPIPGVTPDIPKVSCDLLSTLRDEVEIRVADVTFRTARMSTPTVEAEFQDGTKIRYLGYLAPWVLYTVLVHALIK
ncbi:hypothetical protein HDU93_001220 [Gonapodya sp. JEL0774]|nr:hypothetical protein HDU93_001220 [Gonapodya sp. JEL0774]